MHLASLVALARHGALQMRHEGGVLALGPVHAAFGDGAGRYLARGGGRPRRHRCHGHARGSAAQSTLAHGPRCPAGALHGGRCQGHSRPHGGLTRTTRGPTRAQACDA
eukprot:scaffold5640_cov328-Prasinococcus_capsulatus_cf.AAC.2